MFRKYTVLAAAMMLAATVSAAPAEDADLDRIATSGLCHGTECQRFAISNANCAANRCPIPTDCVHHATIPASGTTSTVVCGSALFCAPTELPPSDASGAPGKDPSGKQASPPVDDYTIPSLTAQEKMLLNLVNEDRIRNGLAPLTADAELCRIARIKSADMRDGSYFSHESPTYGRMSDMLRHFGYPYEAVGENIAHHASVDKAQAAFMSSAGHRANILSRTWTKIGVGIVTDRNGFLYATQVFVR